MTTPAGGSTRIALAVPPLLALKGDPFGSGIPSMPTGAAYLAAYMRERGRVVSLLDAFGEAPERSWDYRDRYVVWGLPPDEVAERLLAEGPDLVGVSVHAGVGAHLTGDLVASLRGRGFSGPIVAGGAFPTTVPEAMTRAGVDYVVLAEGETSFATLVEALEGRRPLEEVDGLAWEGGVNPKTAFIEDLDALPFPAIDLLPLDKYWALRYSHGPFKGPYSFLITSRGCPFKCRFCAAPGIWRCKWRARSPENVVDEIEDRHRRFGISDFHVQDDNMTVDRARTLAICDEIVRRDLPITWSLAAGMKIETIDEAILERMVASGFRYISVSPESASRRVLKAMNKPFDFEHYERMVLAFERTGVKGQACFVLGYPGETAEDLRATGRYVGKLARLGVDEVSLFIMTPLPGAAVYEEMDRPAEFEDLVFTPRWRSDYSRLERARKRFFWWFLVNKLVFHPLKTLRHLPNILRRRFEIKAEMTIYRLLARRFRWLARA